MLIVCHPNQSSFSKINVDNMKAEVDSMLQYRKLQLYKAGREPMPAEVTASIGAVGSGGVWDLVSSS